MLRCDPHRRRRVGAPRPSTPLPDALPAVLIHVFFFDGFEAPDELRRVKGYGAHDLVNTLGRLRRVNREWRRLIDSTFAAWKRKLAVADAPGSDGFFLDLPCLTLYDLRACAGRSCFVCAKEVDPVGRWGEFCGTTRRISSQGEVRDVPVLCCPRCEETYFDKEEVEVRAAFSNADDYPVFFANHSTPPTPFERFSGVVHHMCLARNALFQAHMLARHQEQQRRGIELRLVRKAKTKDARIHMARRLGVTSHACEKVRDFTWDVEFNVSLQGVVPERFLKRAAATSVAADHFVPLEHRCFGSTWQAEELVDAFVHAMQRCGEPEVRQRLRSMVWLGRRAVVCRLMDVRFLSARRNGVAALYRRSFGTMAVWLQLDSVPLHPHGKVPGTAAARVLGVECVVQGQFLRDHFREHQCKALKEADVDARVLAGERNRLRGDERGLYNAAVQQNARFHERRVLAALQRARSSLLLPRFAAALGHTIDRDTSLLRRLANPEDPALPPRRPRKGFPSHYNAGNGAHVLLL